MTICQPLPIMSVMDDLYDQLRRAIEAAPRTREALSRESGIDAGLLCNFVHGKRRLSLRAVVKLADVLGLELVLRPKREG